VRHVVANGPYREALEPLVRELGPLTCMQPAERELTLDLEPLATKKHLTLVPHEGWLTNETDLGKGPPWRMDAFYRRVRKRTGILMDGGKPRGGRLSFDAKNRERWPGTPPAPTPPTFVPDAVTEEVGSLIAKAFARHPGRLDLASLPATHEDAERLWAWARAGCLPHFGPYEDAMSRASVGLFHTRISPLLNLHRLLPSRVVADALAAKIPLPSQEGFVRQVIGWREFVRHVHRATDGFRAGRVKTAKHPGDGGWSRWTGEPWGKTDGDGGALPDALGADLEVPPAYWGAPSGFACLDHVVKKVWDHGWSHHIERLMVLSNLATLVGISPRSLTDWFWVAYVDAYDWVVEPNVLAMGTYGAGDVMTTKPYVSGAAYVNKMSDHCGACAFDPAKDCPFTRLYWAFLERNRAVLAKNPRLRLPLASAARRPADDKARDAKTFERVRAALAAGEALSPASSARASPRRRPSTP
jgi:deoxyribodipyrimidine photolyase-related protein